MKYASVKEFNVNFSDLLNKKENIVITKRGDPIAVLKKINDNKTWKGYLKMKKALFEYKITKQQLNVILNEIKKEVYV